MNFKKLAGIEPTLPALTEKYEENREAKELAAELKKHWRNVKYDEAKGEGTASLGSFEIEFSQSGNDPAVWIGIRKVRRVKADNPRQAVSVLNKLGGLLDKIG